MVKVTGTLRFFGWVGALVLATSPLVACQKPFGVAVNSDAPTGDTAKAPSADEKRAAAKGPRPRDVIPTSTPLTTPTAAPTGALTSTPTPTPTSTPAVGATAAPQGTLACATARPAMPGVVEVLSDCVWSGLASSGVTIVSSTCDEAVVNGSGIASVRVPLRGACTLRLGAAASVDAVPVDVEVRALSAFRNVPQALPSFPTSSIASKDTKSIARSDSGALIVSTNAQGVSLSRAAGAWRSYGVADGMPSLSCNNVGWVGETAYCTSGGGSSTLVLFAPAPSGGNSLFLRTPAQGLPSAEVRHAIAFGDKAYAATATGLFVTSDVDDLNAWSNVAAVEVTAADVRSLAVGDGKLFVATATGLFATTNGVTFSTLSSGSVSHVAATSGMLAWVESDNRVRTSLDAGATHTVATTAYASTLGLAVGFDASSRPFAVATVANNNRLFLYDGSAWIDSQISAGNSRGVPAVNGGSVMIPTRAGIWVSSDLGATSTSISSPSDLYFNVLSLAVAPDGVGERLVVGTNGAAIYANSHAAPEALVTTVATASNISVLHTKGTRVFAMRSSRVTTNADNRASDDAFATHTALGGAGVLDFGITGFAHDDTHLLAVGTVSPYLRVSTDSGTTWANAAANPSACGAARGVVVVLGRWYVAGALGLCVSADQGASWTHHTTADGLPTNDISSLHALGNWLYIGHAGGLARTPVLSASVTTLAFSTLSSSGFSSAPSANIVRMTSNADLFVAAEATKIFVLRNGSTTFEVYDAADGLSGNITSLAFTRDGRLHVGSSSAGVLAWGLASP